MSQSDPDLEGYHLSDSDDLLFDTPAPTHKTANKGSTGTEGKTASTANGKASGGNDGKGISGGDGKTTRYDAEEASKERDAQLKLELENVRKINQVIEGVVESLEKAKSNMGVCFNPRPYQPLTHHLDIIITTCKYQIANDERTKLDGLPHRNLSIDSPPNVVAHPLANRAQPTPDPQSNMARRKPRSLCYRA
jgi:hypothetical protein